MKDDIWLELNLTNGFAVATIFFSLGFIIQTFILLLIR